jgi:hypothetical protein
MVLAKLSIRFHLAIPFALPRHFASRQCSICELHNEKNWIWSTYFNIFAPFLSLRDFLPLTPLVKESFESESELGMLGIVELLSRSS